MKKLSSILFYVAVLLVVMPASAQQVSFSVNKIWDTGNHCAFTSIIPFKGRYYCSFREGITHVFDKDGKAEGKIRILVSDDGDKWESVAYIGLEGVDLRDPKLSVMPDGRMLVTIGGSIYRNRRLEACIPHVMFSEDGKTFNTPEPAVLDARMTSKRDWIWRVTWHESVGYAASYNWTPQGNELWLVKTTDGKHYEAIKKLEVDGSPNEATIRFMADGRMSIMVRREAGDTRGWWGISEAPFTDWQWKKMGLRLGGQDYIFLEDNRIVMATRNYAIPGAEKTCVYIGKDNGYFEEVLVLPSGGDCSYPGILTVGNELWVSYYASHASANASIFLAKIPMSVFK